MLKNLLLRGTQVRGRSKYKMGNKHLLMFVEVWTKTGGMRANDLRHGTLSNVGRGRWRVVGKVDERVRDDEAKEDEASEDEGKSQGMRSSSVSVFVGPLRIRVVASYLLGCFCATLRERKSKTKTIDQGIDVAYCV